MTPLRLLFVKESQGWPRACGHDVHGYHLMRALAARGHAVSLASVIEPTPTALNGLPLAGIYLLDDGRPSGLLPLSQWQRRFTGYYGVEERWGAALADLLRRERFDAVVVVARQLLPLLAAVRGPARVWYAGDDAAWHHLSRVRPWDRRTWGELHPAGVNVLFARAFAGCFDRCWVVSPADRRAARVTTGRRAVDLIPNGVDADHYRPGAEPDLPASAVFWGRLDFGPNVDAIRWFLGCVWPTVRAAHPTASLSVFGFSPTEEVRALALAPGVELHPDLPDLRAEVGRRQAVVLPFVSGGGIKNKLLEAAALGMPIVCTRRALSGLNGRPPVRVAGSPRDWAAALGEVWADPAVRRERGAKARRWVTECHTWEAAARAAEAGLARALRAARRGGG